MTNKEFAYEFDIKYNSIAGPSAPGLNLYEKSVFLTASQLELVKTYIGPLNKYGDSFEGSSKRRADLRELVSHYETTPVKAVDGITDNSYEVKLPENLFITVYEVGYFKPQGCDDSLKLEIVPVKYDELNSYLENPFRGPLKERGLRVDRETGNTRRAELIVFDGIDSYKIRYIKYPSPIVLTNLGGISTLPLSIDGVVEETPCELDEELHREILDRAVELAMLSYKQEALPSTVQLNQRNN